LQERAVLDSALRDKVEKQRPAEPSGYDPHKKLRWLWTLHITGGLKDGIARYGLFRADEFVRAWSIQLACEDKNPSSELLKDFLRLAKDDKSALVRLYLASGLQRLKADQRWDVLNELVRHSEDANDHNLPFLYWYAAEACVASDTERAIALLKNCKIPKVREFIARRLATLGLTAAH
jgi:hypothetical protein